MLDYLERALCVGKGMKAGLYLLLGTKAAFLAFLWHASFTPLLLTSLLGITYTQLTIYPTALSTLQDLALAD